MQAEVEELYAAQHEVKPRIDLTGEQKVAGAKRKSGAKKKKKR
jgi:hypothetical protein